MRFVNMFICLMKASLAARSCSQQLDQERLRSLSQQDKWTSLQRCHEKLSHFSPERFQEAKTQACSLHTSTGVQVWNMTWKRCQEVSRHLEDILQELERARPAEHGPSPHRGPGDGQGSVAVVPGDAPVLRRHDARRNSLGGPDRESVYGTVSCFNINFRQSRKVRKGTRVTGGADLDQNIRNQQNQKTAEGSHTPGCQWFSWQPSSDPSSCRTQVHRSTSTKPQTSRSICTTAQALEPQSLEPTGLTVLSESSRQTSVHHQYPHRDVFFSETLGCQTRMSGRSSSWGSDVTTTRSSSSTANNTR